MCKTRIDLWPGQYDPIHGIRWIHRDGHLAGVPLSHDSELSRGRPDRLPVQPARAFAEEAAYTALPGSQTGQALQLANQILSQIIGWRTDFMRLTFIKQ